MGKWSLKSDRMGKMDPVKGHFSLLFSKWKGVLFKKSVNNCHLVYQNLHMFIDILWLLHTTTRSICILLQNCYHSHQEFVSQPTFNKRITIPFEMLQNNAIKLFDVKETTDRIN